MTLAPLYLTSQASFAHSALSLCLLCSLPNLSLHSLSLGTTPMEGPLCTTQIVITPSQTSFSLHSEAATKVLNHRNGIFSPFLGIREN